MHTQNTQYPLQVIHMEKQYFHLRYEVAVALLGRMGYVLFIIRKALSTMFFVGYEKGENRNRHVLLYEPYAIHNP